MLAATFTVHVWVMSVLIHISDPTSANCIYQHFAALSDSARFIQTCVVSFVGVSVHFRFTITSGEFVAIALGR